MSVRLAPNRKYPEHEVYVFVKSRKDTSAADVAEHFGYGVIWARQLLYRNYDKGEGTIYISGWERAIYKGSPKPLYSAKKGIEQDAAKPIPYTNAQRQKFARNRVILKELGIQS